MKANGYSEDEILREIHRQICKGDKLPVCKAQLPVCEGIAHLEMQHFTEPQPITCKWCGSDDIMKYGIRRGVQNYICKACGRVFIAKDVPYHMMTPTEQIGAALNMYYDGMSLSAIATHLKETYNNPVNASTVYRWLIRYTFIALNILEPLQPKVSDTWIIKPATRPVSDAAS